MKECVWLAALYFLNDGLHSICILRKNIYTYTSNIQMVQRDCYKINGRYALAVYYMKITIPKLHAGPVWL